MSKAALRSRKRRAVASPSSATLRRPSRRRIRAVSVEKVKVRAGLKELGVKNSLHSLRKEVGVTHRAVGVNL